MLPQTDKPRTCAIEHTLLHGNSAVEKPLEILNGKKEIETKKRCAEEYTSLRTSTSKINDELSVLLRSFLDSTLSIEFAQAHEDIFLQKISARYGKPDANPAPSASRKNKNNPPVGLWKKLDPDRREGTK
jgi:hypothetical protein